MRKAISDLTLEEELSRKDDLPPEHYTGEHFLEDTAFLILGESGDYDVAAVQVLFRVGGKAWGVEDALLKQTSFMAVPKDTRGKMLDNDFIGCRTDPVRPCANFEVVQEPGKVTWKAGDYQLIASPPYWQAKGEHHGVKFDVNMGGLGKASRFLGNWSELPKAGRAGFEQPLWAEGTISARGKDYPLTNAFGIHEKVIIGDAWVVGKALERWSRHYWIWAMSEETQVFTYVKEAVNVVYGTLHSGNAHVQFGPGQVSVNELEFWDCPRTGRRLPVRWHVNMATDEGLVDLNIVANGRFVYNYLFADGHITYYGFLCRSNGRVFHKNGGVTRIEDMITYVECGIFPTPLGVN